VTSPQADEFAELALRGNLIPVVREVLADLDTPLSLFRQLDDGASSFLLESVEGGEKWARYSLIGVGSRARFQARGANVEWTERGETRRFDAGGDPLAVLRARLAEFRPVTLPGVELPRFTGGAVGMVGYDWVRFIEKLPDANPDPIGLPDVWFSFPDSSRPPTPMRSRRPMRWSSASATRERPTCGARECSRRWKSSAA
jgi:anthranilate synthase component 1